MKKYITAKEAATITDLATNTITLAAQQGLVNGFKKKGKWFLLSQDVINLKKNPHKKGLKRERQEDIGQISLFDPEATPAYMPRHAKVKDERDYDKIPRYTLQDLKKQFELGVQAGLNAAIELNKVKEVNNV